MLQDPTSQQGYVREQPLGKAQKPKRAHANTYITTNSLAASLLVDSLYCILDFSPKPIWNTVKVHQEEQNRSGPRLDRLSSFVHLISAISSVLRQSPACIVPAQDPCCRKRLDWRCARSLSTNQQQKCSPRLEQDQFSCHEHCAFFNRLIVLLKYMSRARPTLF